MSLMASVCQFHLSSFGAHSPCASYLDKRLIIEYIITVMSVNYPVQKTEIGRAWQAESSECWRRTGEKAEPSANSNKRKSTIIVMPCLGEIAWGPVCLQFGEGFDVMSHLRGTLCAFHVFSNFALFLNLAFNCAQSHCREAPFPASHMHLTFPAACRQHGMVLWQGGCLEVWPQQVTVPFSHLCLITYKMAIKMLFLEWRQNGGPSCCCSSPLF